MREVVCVVVLALLLTGGVRLFTSDWAKLEHEIYLKIHDAMYRTANPEPPPESTVIVTDPADK